MGFRGDEWTQGYSVVWGEMYLCSKSHQSYPAVNLPYLIKVLGGFEALTPL